MRLGVTFIHNTSREARPRSCLRSFLRHQWTFFVSLFYTSSLIFESEWVSAWVTHSYHPLTRRERSCYCVLCCEEWWLVGEYLLQAFGLLQTGLSEWVSEWQRCYIVFHHSHCLVSLLLSGYVWCVCGVWQCGSVAVNIECPKSHSRQNSDAR